MWNLLVDKTDCWLEASGSAMFAYAMIMEVKKGWLDAAEYGLVAWKVWKLFRKEVCFWGVRDRPLFLWSFLKYSRNFFLCLELNEYFRAHIYNF